MKWIRWGSYIAAGLVIIAGAAFWMWPLHCQAYFPLLGELLTERPTSDEWLAAEFDESPPVRQRLTTQDYFPELTFKLAVDGTSFMELSLANELLEFGEESLYKRRINQAVHVYRFMWRRSFDPAIIVRIEINPDGTGLLTSKHFALRPVGKGKTTQREKSLTRSQISKLVELFEQKQFWQSPADDDIYGLDGSTWVFEGCRGGVYHVVKRWSPETDDPLRTIGLTLLESAGFWRGPVY